MKQKLIFFLYLIVLILPNLILCVTETMPLMGKMALVLLPLGLYWTVLPMFYRLSRTFLWMFPILFLGAFNIVLSYLFGKGVIAVDMWLNLTTSSPAEMGEMLSQIYPAVVAVVVIYIPTLAYAAYDACKKTELTIRFMKHQMCAGLAILLLSLPITFMAARSDKWTVLNDLFPVNVCYNLRLAIERQSVSEKYIERSSNFVFDAVHTDTDTVPKVVLLVIGETSRAANWQLNGYERETTPLLMHTPNLAVFTDCMSQSNTTHKSIPILLSPATADNYDVLYHSKGLLAAFNEAGFHTAFISNEPRNNSFNDHLGEQAQEVMFLRDKMDGTPMDSLLLPEIQKVLEQNMSNLLLVVHTYGSHSTYSDRYERYQAHFTPDIVLKATKDNRDILINAYDNTIRYTDRLLHNIIMLLQTQGRQAAMLYASDHGEDIYDDSRNLYLHASPWPSYYQLHVPFLVWTNDLYRQTHAERVELLESRTAEPIQTDCIFPTMLGLGGVSTPYGQDSLSLTSLKYTTKEQRTYLSDHNEPLTFDRCLEKEDFLVMKQHGLRTY
ncbi:MAG: phosphoethanolamine transferase [Bacteroidaceae bacterium]|nr:phosphoethanolamine transferase [Bacteroidaceae bacterium]